MSLSLSRDWHVWEKTPSRQRKNHLKSSRLHDTSQGWGLFVFLKARVQSPPDPQRIGCHPQNAHAIVVGLRQQGMDATDLASQLRRRPLRIRLN